MDFRAPLAKVRGLGSAKTGAAHWWMQRVSAVALLPLSLLVIVFLNLCLTAPYQQTVAWLAAPVNTVGLMAWIIAAFYHAALGLQVVIEDYVADDGVKIVGVWAVKLVLAGFGLAALLAVLRIVLAG